MNYTIRRSFILDDKAYEVRVWTDGQGYLVQCFHHNQPIGLRYGVSPEIADDFAQYRGESAIDALAEVAATSLRTSLERDDFVV